MPPSIGAAVCRPSPPTAITAPGRDQRLAPRRLLEQEPVRTDVGEHTGDMGGPSAAQGHRASECSAEPLGQPDRPQLRACAGRRLSAISGRLGLVELRPQVCEQLLPPHGPPPGMKARSLWILMFACIWLF